MRKEYYLTILLFLLSYSTICYSKNPKRYVWEPNKYSVNVTSNYSGKIILIISDERNLPPKTKIKFTSENLVNYLENSIREVFPFARISNNVNEMDETNNVVCFKIHIMTYEARFEKKITARDFIISPIITGGSSRWYGETIYQVEKMNFQEKNITPNSLTFRGEDSAKNWKGFSSGKKALSSSFKQATDALFNYFVMSTN